MVHLCSKALSYGQWVWLFGALLAFVAGHVRMWKEGSIPFLEMILFLECGFFSWAWGYAPSSEKPTRRKMVTSDFVFLMTPHNGSLLVDLITRKDGQRFVNQVTSDMFLKNDSLRPLHWDPFLQLLLKAEIQISYLGDIPHTAEWPPEVKFIFRAQTGCRFIFPLKLQQAPIEALPNHLNRLEAEWMAQSS